MPTVTWSSRCCPGRDRICICRVVTGGTLGERKGVNLPGVKTVLPSLTKKDKEDLEFGIEMGVDYMALSFVRSGRDVRALKRALKSKGADIPVISKIEKPQALEDLEAILDASDGVMVARGDLGVELSPEKVPMAQKRIIRMANEQYKWVITATQMLESMTDHARPTRAETSDVANAILDGTDAVMLSGETSVGRYPVGSVKMMDRIARETEKEFPSGVYTAPSRHQPAKGFPDAISLAACTAADSLGLKGDLRLHQVRLHGRPGLQAQTHRTDHRLHPRSGRTETAFPLLGGQCENHAPEETRRGHGQSHGGSTPSGKAGQEGGSGRCSGRDSLDDRRYRQPAQTA